MSSNISVFANLPASISSILIISTNIAIQCICQIDNIIISVRADIVVYVSLDYRWGCGCEWLWVGWQSDSGGSLNPSTHDLIVMCSWKLSSTIIESGHRWEDLNRHHFFYSPPTPDVGMNEMKDMALYPILVNILIYFFIYEYDCTFEYECVCMCLFCGLLFGGNCAIVSFLLFHTPPSPRAIHMYLIKPFHSVIGLPRTPCFLVRTNQQTNNNLFFFNSPPLGLTRVIPLATVHLSIYRILFTPQHTPPPVFFKTATDLEGL